MIGYKDNYVVQGFNILNSEKSHKILETFSLFTETFYPDFERDDYLSLLRNEDSLDYLGKRSLVRKEQGYLRRHLFDNKANGLCSICGREFPVKLLVAAHIKKRADCSLEEKKDFENIVTPMCKLGCDDLYEKGFFGVSNGCIVSLGQPSATETVKEYISTLENNKCAAWSDSTKPYFRWHYFRHDSGASSG